MPIFRNSFAYRKSASLVHKDFTRDLGLLCCYSLLVRSRLARPNTLSVGAAFMPPGKLTKQPAGCATRFYLSIGLICMALDQGDSSVAAAPESCVAAPQENISSVAADSQVGACQMNDDIKAANDQYMTDLGFPPASVLDTGDQDEVEETPAKPDVNEVQKPDVQGDVQALNPENQQRLNELKQVGDQSCTEDNCNLATTQKALQDKADAYGTNPDGSPKVSILANQTAYQLESETNFYASFNNSRMQQETNQLLLEGARRYGDQKTFPSGSVGHVGTVIGGNGPRI